MSYFFNTKLHCHTFEGQPLYGTSTVVKDVMPPFLAKWGATCAVDWLKEHNEDWDGAILAWSKVRKEAADKGTDMHEKLEEYVKKCISGNKGIPLAHSVNEVPQVSAFVNWSLANVKEFIFSEQCTFSKRLWVGGVVDCLARLKDDTLAVVDFKSSKEAYFNQFVQAAGYALQLEESGYGSEDGKEWKTLGENIKKLIVIPFGAKNLKPETIENVKGFEEVFGHVVEVYKFLSDFNK